MLQGVAGELYLYPSNLPLFLSWPMIDLGLPQGR